MVKFKEFEECRKGQEWTLEQIAQISGQELPPDEGNARQLFAEASMKQVQDTLVERKLPWVVREVDGKIRILTDWELSEEMQRRADDLMSKDVATHRELSSLLQEYHTIDESELTGDLRRVHENRNRYLARRMQWMREHELTLTHFATNSYQARSQRRRRADRR